MPVYLRDGFAQTYTCCHTEIDILRKAKNREEWRKLVAKSTVVHQRSARLRGRYLLVGWLLNVLATCQCISGTDLLNVTCCHTEIEVADQTFDLTQSRKEKGETDKRTQRQPKVKETDRDGNRQTETDRDGHAQRQRQCQIQSDRERGRETQRQRVCWLLACLTSQQHASVSQRRICSDNFTCCHTETEVANQTFYLTQSQYTDTEPTSPSADPIMPGACQGSHWSASF